ncbi:hypothetical protein KC359_g126 [Hortaea werneckii]|nr:hypothetical protein KC359_g126 [Hortaea werneckii]KAI7515020.1 hypothetical protein KC347_g121 [Hortaea werneckii]
MSTNWIRDLRGLQGLAIEPRRDGILMEGVRDGGALRTEGLDIPELWSLSSVGIFAGNSATDRLRRGQLAITEGVIAWCPLRGLVGRVVGTVLRAIVSLGRIFDQVVERGLGNVGRRFGNVEVSGDEAMEAPDHGVVVRVRLLARLSSNLDYRPPDMVPLLNVVATGRVDVGARARTHLEVISVAAPTSFQGGTKLLLPSVGGRVVVGAGACVYVYVSVSVSVLLCVSTFTAMDTAVTEAHEDGDGDGDDNVHERSMSIRQCTNGADDGFQVRTATASLLLSLLQPHSQMDWEGEKGLVPGPLQPAASESDSTQRPGSSCTPGCRLGQTPFSPHLPPAITLHP